MPTTEALRYPLTADQCEQYERDGYVIVRDVFRPAEVAEMSAEADRLLQRTDLMSPNNMRVRFKPHVETGEKLFEVFDPFLDLAPVCRRYVLDRRMLDPLASIYGEAACLFKDKLIYKPPGSDGAHLHQDYIAWPRFPKSFLTVVLAIDAFERDNGCTEVYPGVHRRGYLSPADGQYCQLDEAAVASVKPVPLLLEPGELAIFGCLTPHRAAANRSTRWRRGLFISYNAHSEGGQQRDEHYQDFHAWLRDKYPAERGELIFR
jgi:ectoine hydroxylase-related dioxygenase (phytanoyl-CoA dioxygenase family)